MYLIKIEANEKGMRPPIINSNDQGILDGYATISEEQTKVFYPKNKLCAGFVNIEVEDGKVTNIEWNEEAYQNYISNLPKDDSVNEPDEQDDVNSMLVDHEYRLTLLELGV